MRKMLFSILFLSLLLVNLTGCQNENEGSEGNHVNEVEDLVSFDTTRDTMPRSLVGSITDLNDDFTNEKKIINKPEREEVRGIYLNPWAIKEEEIGRFIEFVKASPRFNAVVMDLKDDNGKLTYNSNVDLVKEIGADDGAVIADLPSFLKRFKDEGIYTIARIVTFKDPFLAEKKSEWALQRKDGSLWLGPDSIKWLDPYREKMWTYVMDIVEEIADSGINEIQYDYIRFPENAKKVDQEVEYANADQLNKDELIEKFLKYSKERLDHYPVLVSADVFGLVTSSTDDMGIGQTWEKMAPHIDFISPMNYPSHYSAQSYGLQEPNDEPYALIKAAMEDALERNQSLEIGEEQVATIRPWLQDFNYKRTYTKDDVLAQIKALNDLGINEYLIWNPSSKYTELD